MRSLPLNQMNANRPLGTLVQWVALVSLLCVATCLHACGGGPSGGSGSKQSSRSAPTSELLLSVDLGNTSATFVAEDFPTAITSERSTVRAQYLSSSGQILIHIHAPISTTEVLVGLQSSQNVFSDASPVERTGYYRMPLPSESLVPQADSDASTPPAFSLVLSTHASVNQTVFDLAACAGTRRSGHCA